MLCNTMQDRIISPILSKQVSLSIISFFSALYILHSIIRWWWVYSARCHLFNGVSLSFLSLYSLLQALKTALLDAHAPSIWWIFFSIKTSDFLRSKMLWSNIYLTSFMVFLTTLYNIAGHIVKKRIFMLISMHLLE